MNNQRPLKWLTLVILLAALVLVMLPISASADFGGFAGDNDYGSSDWGSSDWDSSDWDSDSSWSFGNDSYYTGSGGGTSLDGGDFLVAAVVVIIILAVTILGSKRRRGSRQQTEIPNAGGTPTSATVLRPISDYTTLDAHFDVMAMQEKLANLYVQMQQAWQSKDIEPIRPYLTDALFEQMERQLQSLRQRHVTNYIERIAVLGVDLRGWYQQDGQDCLVASLRTRIVDYTRSDENQEVVQGDPNRELFMEYEWTLVRTTGLTTEAESGMTDLHCPNCGAPLEINHSARCPYCDSVITLAEHDWAIRTIKGISQRTAQ